MFRQAGERVRRGSARLPRQAACDLLSHLREEATLTKPAGLSGGCAGGAALRAAVEALDGLRVGITERGVEGSARCLSSRAMLI